MTLFLPTPLDETNADDRISLCSVWQVVVGVGWWETATLRDTKSAANHRSDLQLDMGKY